MPVKSQRDLVQGIVVILRSGLDHIPLSQSISDNDLRPHATLLFKRIKADESELALRRTVADIQRVLDLPVNDHRCKGIVSQASALVRKNSN